MLTRHVGTIQWVGGHGVVTTVSVTASGASSCASVVFAICHRSRLPNVGWSNLVGCKRNWGPTSDIQALLISCLGHDGDMTHRLSIVS